MMSNAQIFVIEETGIEFLLKMGDSLPNIGDHVEVGDEEFLVTKRLWAPEPHGLNGETGGPYRLKIFLSKDES